jgi:ribonuclease HI
LKRVTIHTDGGCQGNPGPGAWAAVLQYGRQELEIGGAVAATTNNRMELQAAIQALAALNQACEIVFFTDSQYLRQGIQSWIHGWKRNGWKTSTKEPVKNADLWQQLDAQASRHRIEWRWLKGHAGHPLNERCDVRANAEMAALRKTMSPAQLAAALAEFNHTN